MSVADFAGSETRMRATATSCRMFDNGKLHQFIAVFTATISAISDGMQYGWTSPVIPILNSPETPVKITEKDVIWLENIYMIAGFCGLPLTIICVERLGRKRSIVMACCMNLLAWLLIGTASSVEQLYVARFITGMAGDTAFVAIPMYIAEIADKKIRGFLGAFIYIMMLVGIVTCYSVAPFVSIAVSSAVGASFQVFQLLTFPFMPDSPYYQLIKGNPDGAKKSLQRLRNREDVDEELKEITDAVERQSQEEGRPSDLFMVPSNLKALIIMTVLNASQHFSSISVMLMNLHSILADADGILAPSTAAIIFAIIMLCASTFASLLIDKAGRKTLLASSSLLTGLSLLVLAIYFTVKNSGADIRGFNWIPVATVMVYAAVFKYGLGMVPIVMTGELFPTSVKAMGMTIADAMYVLFAVISITIYQHFSRLWGEQVPFFIFSASCLFTTVFVILAIPETKGKTLEEIQLILKGEYVTQVNGKTEGEKHAYANNTMDSVL